MQEEALPGDTWLVPWSNRRLPVTVTVARRGAAQDEDAPQDVETVREKCWQLDASLGGSAHRARSRIVLGSGVPEKNNLEATAQSLCSMLALLKGA